jgi:hypothetical protein
MLCNLQVCTRYAEDLARCRNGSRVLLEVISAFFPANLMHKLVLLLSGQEVGNLDEEDDEDDEDEEEEDSEEEEEDDEEEKDEMEVVPPEDEEDVDEDEDEEEEEEEDGNFDGSDEEQDASTRGGSGGKKEQKAAAAAAPVLGLEEDASAQRMLRKVLELQARAETEEGSTLAAEWEQVPSDEQGGLSFYSFAGQLVEALQEAEEQSGLFQHWAARNRSAFLLSDLVAVPSARAGVLAALGNGSSSASGSKKGGGAKSFSWTRSTRAARA